ncbi:MAG: ATP-binding cassette domain-containing protein [Roseobacter sp.]
MTFDIPENRIFGILGESGYGKSTLINAILGLLVEIRGPSKARRSAGGQAGQLVFALKQDRAAVLDPLSTVFQDPMGAFTPVVSFGRQIINIQYRSGLSKQAKVTRAADVLELVRIPDARAALSRYPHQFSGGMARCVGVAPAIAMALALILADEPTAGLDVSVQGEVQNLLNDLRERLGLAMVIIPHNLHVVHHVADRAAEVYLGPLC